MNIRKQKTRAFTLIELIVVVLIIAVLAAMIVPRIVGRTGQSKQAAAINDLSTLAGLLEQFRIDCGRYPSTEEGLTVLLDQPADVDNWQGPYMQKQSIPLDPWKNEYYYEIVDTEQYVLMSFGADGQEGGEGENEDLIANQ